MSDHPPIDSQITFLYTGDLETTARFYEDVLGLPLWRDQDTCRIYSIAEGSYIGFCQRKMPQTFAGPGLDHIILTLVTPEVDEWYEHLAAQDVLFEKAPAKNVMYNIYHCFFRDPNGYLIELQEFLD